MAITNISADAGYFPRIVRIITTDNFSTITAVGYLITQMSNINSLQNGGFQWAPSDFVAINYNGGKAFFSPDYTVNYTFVPLYGSNGGFTWVDVTSGSATPINNTGYMADSTSLTTIILPTLPLFGDSYKFLNVNTGGMKIVYGTGQSIVFGQSQTTPTSGSLSSLYKGDEVNITAYSATLFYAYSPQGNLSGV